MDPTTSKKLADWVLSYDHATVSEQLIAKALDCILDNLTAALAGQALIPSRAAQTATKSSLGTGQSKIWFSGRRSTPAGAAFCNSMAASSLDFDDGHRKARGHPGSAIVPSVLAVMEHEQFSDRDVLCAIIVGYEVAVRAAQAQNQNGIKTHQTGRWAGLGVVAACGRLTGLTSAQLAHAFAIAGLWAPNQLANGSSGYATDTGNWAKEGIPISALQAMLALDLAKQGLTGPTDLFDFESHYASPTLVPDAGAPTAILGTYFKRYACCRYIHPALDAWQRQFGTGAIDVDQIDRIEVETFGWALKLANKTHPQTPVDVQFSLPYCLALTILYGPQVLVALEGHHLDNARAQNLATKITLRACPELDRKFPDQTLAQLRVVTSTGHSFSSAACVEPIALGHDEIVEKLCTIAVGKISNERCQALVRVLSPKTAALGHLYALL